MHDPNANRDVNPGVSGMNPDVNQSAGQAQDPISAYSSLDADKRMLVAQAFIRRLANKKDDPQAQQYGNLDPRTVTPELLADIHQYTAQRHPEVLSEVLQNPTVTDHLGDFASSQLGNLGGAMGGATGGNMGGAMGGNPNNNPSGNINSDRENYPDNSRNNPNDMGGNRG